VVTRPTSESDEEISPRSATLLYRGVGQLLILGGLVAGAMFKWGSHHGPGVSMEVSWFAYVVASGCFLIGVRLNHYGRKLQLIEPSGPSPDDGRPPVLYLRPFAIDAELSQVPGNHPDLSARTEEEQMIAVLGEPGPVVAIGEPGERLPQLGASRTYVIHESWQDAVRVQIEKARLVVLAPGTSPGVMWELRSASRC
jgi:hypothetical protein